MPIDSGMIRSMLFAVLFGSVFVGLLAVAGIGGFVVSSENYNNPSMSFIPSGNLISFSGYNFTESWNHTLSWNTGYAENFDIGDRNLGFYQTYSILPAYNTLRLTHLYGIGLLFHEDMNWYDVKENQLSYAVGLTSVINSDGLDIAYSSMVTTTYNDTHNYAELTVRCLGLGSDSTRFEVVALSIFNKTAYSKPSSAWYNNDLFLIIGITPENSGHVIDVMSILTSLLTFNTYAIFGSTDSVAIILNGIIVVMICLPTTVFVILFIKELLSDWL